MSLKPLPTVLCFVVLVACSPGFSQTLKTRVLAEAPSLKVLGADDFPKDLACEIHVGPNPYPSFSTKGANGIIDAANIRVSVDFTVSVYRKHTENESYYLSFFSSREGKAFLLLDLNMDGEWDVKFIPDGEARGNYIFAGTGWIEVVGFNDLKSAAPKAVTVKGEKHYEFHDKWKVVN